MSKTNIILQYLKNGNYISDAKAVQLCGNYRLSSTIYELRHRHGLNIQDRWNESNGNKFKEYYLVNDQV